jgi:hypothetical protein
MADAEGDPTVSPLNENGAHHQVMTPVTPSAQGMEMFDSFDVPTPFQCVSDQDIRDKFDAPSDDEDEGSDMSTPLLESKSLCDLETDQVQAAMSPIMNQEVNKQSTPPTAFSTMVKSSVPSETHLRPRKRDDLKGLVDLIGAMEICKESPSQDLPIFENPLGVKKVGVPVRDCHEGSSVTVLTPVKASAAQKKGCQY